MGPTITRTCYPKNRSSAIQFKRDRETDISRLYCSIGKIYKELNSKIKPSPGLKTQAAQRPFFDDLPERFQRENRCLGPDHVTKEVNHLTYKPPQSCHAIKASCQER